MRCLVTGVAGFVGSHLAERLLADGHEVSGIDGFIDYCPRYIKERNLEGPRSWKRFTFVEGNLLSIDLMPVLEGVDWIFHQAAQAGVRASWGQEFARSEDCNVLATQRLLEAAVRIKGLRRLLLAAPPSGLWENNLLAMHRKGKPQSHPPFPAAEVIGGRPLP